MTVRVRFAPSPTGFVHIGSLRTALYNYLFAKKNNGKYILRLEDTDQSRFVDGAIEGMLTSMDWAKVCHDEGVIMNDAQIAEKGEYGPYTQSKRLDIYIKYIQELLQKGDAYYCFCSKERIDKVREQQKEQGLTAKYDGLCRDISLEEAQKRIDEGENYVVRLKLPSNTNIEFEDIVRGNIVVNTEDIDDQVLIKADGFPTYHFAVVIDDHLMGITHVIRGEEWLPSTPKHVYLYKVYGWQTPKYVHLSNILNTEKKKLSKRQGDVAVEDFYKKGYLPEALINYVALIGWSPEDNQEIFSMEELESKFSLDRVSKAGGVFDINKLNWMNAYYIKETCLNRITDLAIPYLIEAGYITKEQSIEKYEWIKDMVSLVRESISYMQEITKKVELFFKTDIQLDDEEAKEIIAMEHVPRLLEIFIEKISAVEEVDEAFAKKTFKEIQKETGIKGPNLFKPIRVAVTGKSHGPDLPLTIKVLGRQKIISRIQYLKENFI